MDGMRREGVLLFVEGESMLEREDIGPEGGELTGGSRLGVDIVCSGPLFIFCWSDAIERISVKVGTLRSSIGRGAHFRHMQDNRWCDVLGVAWC